MSESAPALTPFKPPRLPKLDGSSTFGGIFGASRRTVFDLGG